MTYVLREQVKNRYYCKDHNKIIEFDTIDQARNFLAQFSQVTILMGMRAMNDPEISDLGEINAVCQSTIVEEKPDNCECEFINFNDICGK